MRNTERTVREWFEAEPEPWRHVLLERLDAHRADVGVLSFSSALYRGFIWADTPEGFNFWERYYYSSKLRGCLCIASQPT